MALSIATLLEPNLQFRAEAEIFVKKLYDVRSRILHGDTLDGQEGKRLHARRLAAAILRAMVSRRKFMADIGFKPQTPDDFLRELDQEKFREGQTVGVDEPEIRKLWRPVSHTDTT